LGDGAPTGGAASVREVAPGAATAREET
jgi:hypothetical protein